MKKTLTLLGLCCGFMMASAQDLSQLSQLHVSASYQQNNFVTYSLSLGVTDNDTGVFGTVDTVDLVAPDGSAVGATPTGYSVAFGDPTATPPYAYWFAGDNYAHRADIPGGHYQVRFTGGSLDHRVLHFRVNERLLPDKAPLFSDKSLHSLQYAKGKRAIKVKFPAQKTPDNAIQANLIVTVDEHTDPENPQFSEQRYNSGPLPLCTKVVVLPANTLGDGKYTIGLNYLVTGPASQDGLSTDYFLYSGYDFERSARTAVEEPFDD